MLTMLLGGLWHGAAWTFVIWGALHGLYLVIERQFRGKIKLKHSGIQGISLAFLTYMCVNITWVFFRAKEFVTAKQMLVSMFFVNKEGTKVLQTFEIIQVASVITILFLCHWFMRNTSMKAVHNKTNLIIFGIFWAILVFLVLISQGSGEQFIYFQF